MNEGKPDETALGADEKIVFQYLKNFSEDYVSEMEITRQADGRERFEQDKRWAHAALVSLVELGLVTTDGFGRYRVKPARSPRPDFRKKYLSPQMRDILEQSNKPIDLSNYD